MFTNILHFYIRLSEDDRVRVTDVDVSKHVFVVTGTLAGISVYRAPEVLVFKMHEFSADIYSLGIMLWEMWHGQQAFTNIMFKSLLEIRNLIVNQGRCPEHDNKCNPPPPSWEKLIKKCWEKNPAK